jgi:hypothetical protein
MFAYFARVLPLKWRRQLPLFGYAELFVQTYATTQGSDRGAYLTYAFTSGIPYAEALKRYGGIRSAFQLVLGSDVPPEVALLFEAENIPADKIKTVDVANNVLMALNFVAAPDYLRDRGDLT